MVSDTGGNGRETLSYISYRKRRRTNGYRLGGSRNDGLPTIDVTALAWQASATCATSDPELFFPEGPVHPYAVRLCRECPVMPECLEFALADPRLHGIWGGTTGEERHRIRDRARGRAG